MMSRALITPHGAMPPAAASPGARRGPGAGVWTRAGARYPDNKKNNKIHKKTPPSPPLPVHRLVGRPYICISHPQQPTRARDRHCRLLSTAGASTRVLHCILASRDSSLTIH
jgi:hypothetical protein